MVHLLYLYRSSSSRHFLGAWVDSRTNLDMVSKGIIPTPAGNETPVIQPTTSHFSELFQLIFGGWIGS